MRVFLCVCVTAVLIIRVNGQPDTDDESLCGGVADYDLCRLEWKCNEFSRCFCKSNVPYCRCNNYVGEFYIDDSCTQKWSVLTFALVASLPGITLALVVGVTVHVIHFYRKSSKSARTPEEENTFPGIVFASDVNTGPKGPSPAPRSLQGGVPMAAVTSQPYSTSGNMHPVSDRPQTGGHRPTYSTPGDIRHTDAEGRFDRPVLGGSPQPYSYIAGSGQVFSNPYAKARNPYEDNGPSDLHQDHRPNNRVGVQYSAAPVAPDNSITLATFPRAQFSRP
ncbi:uncharacterized protein LOC143488802 [Brachyhypopomus gauderio]|uniref:uncharacterized protein LOC143488802 n=1 Tax=Brachyhypopomus gauderio TaxID=698409 RepID=UPI0040410F5E